MKNVLHTWFFVITYALFVSYIISRYFLVGEQVLTRRLDVVLAFLAVMMFVIFKDWLIARALEMKRSAVPMLLVTILVGSIAITASYSLGPDTKTVSIDEYTAMEYIWSQEKGQEHHCIIADTYPLLALEAISKKEIVGGGFPINAYFGQPERESIFEYYIDGRYRLEDYTRLSEAFSITNANVCWIVDASRSDSPVFDYYEMQPPKNIEVKAFNHVRLWKYIKN